MNKLSISIISVCLSSLPAFAFHTENPETNYLQTPIELLEAGLAHQGKVPEAIYLLGQGHYEDALAAAESDGDVSDWLRTYLTDLVGVSGGLVKQESENFLLFTPPGQEFLGQYALPALEETRAYLKKMTGHAPAGKIRVEIYPTKEAFSKASTLSEETLERSGAIGICKFHRLMILTPQALPLGYRWMDALSHEYTHLMVNELSQAKAELWLHEGTARYFETGYRLPKPDFLTPHHQTQLLEALEKQALVPFKKMSPSLVYLKDQDEVSLAFAQVSHAVAVLINEKSNKAFVSFLKSLSKDSFSAAFKKAFGLTPEEFETHWMGKLSQEKWEKSKGSLSDDVRFAGLDEDAVIGPDAKARIQLGDRLRQRGHIEAALIEYEKGLKEEPDNAVILLKAAKTLLQLGKKEEALQKLRRATEKNPNYGTPQVELGLLAEDKEALPHLWEAIGINPFDPRVHQRLGEIHERRGERARADGEKRIAEELFNRLR